MDKVKTITFHVDSKGNWSADLFLETREGSGLHASTSKKYNSLNQCYQSVRQDYLHEITAADSDPEEKEK